eukprot:Hpha_TRINITY_DN16079_c0_g1::TRINITY_DN16079_c0_g1_i11::g.117922::m.117922
MITKPLLRTYVFLFAPLGNTTGSFCSTNYDCCGMPHCCAWAVCGCDGNLCDGKDGNPQRCFQMGNCFDECTCGQPNCYPVTAFVPHLRAYRLHAQKEGIKHGGDRAEAEALTRWIKSRGIVLRE